MPQPIPNLFIIGAPRSGTTSVAKWLSRHPDVAAGRRKEPMYHARDLPSPMSTTDRDAYLNLWAGTESVPMRLEGSTWYLYSKEAASSIARMSPEARFIVHFRHPVDLLASLHTHHVFIGVETERDFESAVFGARPPDSEDFRRSIDYLEVVRLAGQLRRFYEHFSQDRVIFVDFAKMSRDPEAAHLNLLDDLGLSPVPLSDYPHMNRGRHQRVAGANQRFTGSKSVAGRGIRRVVTKLNTAAGRPPVDPGLRRRILEAIVPDIDELAELIDRDLSDWKSV